MLQLYSIPERNDFKKSRTQDFSASQNSTPSNQSFSSFDKSNDFGILSTETLPCTERNKRNISSNLKRILSFQNLSNKEDSNQNSNNESCER